jgi:hypothetical protein
MALPLARFDGTEVVQWWRSPASKGGQVTAEGKSRDRTRGGESEVRELSLCTHAWDKDGQSTWDRGVRSPPRHPAAFEKWARLHFVFSKLFNRPNIEI